MIYDLNTLEVGSRFARLLLLTSVVENTFSVFEDERGTITSIYTDTLYPDDDELHTLCTVRRDRDGTEQRWFVSDLLGHDNTVICVSLDEVERYQNPSAFSGEAMIEARELASAHSQICAMT